ncbi:MAG: hypothetical protein IJU58_02935 [Clostridia bacterium]|nr:hypothetical protein [Clostridia bacterium]
MKNTKLIQNDKDLVEQIKKDYQRRKEERKPFEAQWQLNINFLMGNQYCGINSQDNIDDFDKQYFWQEREVYNHIAPIIDVRLAKLARVRTQMSVQPSSTQEDDVANAKLCKNILESTANRLGFNNIISEVTRWSEICGTGFYKIVWNDKKGAILGIDDQSHKICQGDIDIVPCSPFEIFPDSNTNKDISSCRSIMHVRAFDVDVIKQVWGVEIKGEDIDTFNLSNSQVVGGLGYLSSIAKVCKTAKHNQALVIERYTMPSTTYPNGRIEVVAGDQLVYVGDLPYKNLENGERGLPFVRQVSIDQPSLFWGSCIIDRIIPVQRAYNAVKNRKHEFLNRIAMGVMTVEDGSVDIENLEDEGLSPGKILVYRQGSNAPRMLASESVPADFSNEEDRLSNEFLSISGISDWIGSNFSAISGMSGTAIELLLDQENIRITSSSESIINAIKTIAKHILRLYKQFASTRRVSLIANDNDAGVFYWNSSNITSDDVIVTIKNEMNETLAQRRNMLMELLKSGLFTNDQGKMDNALKTKALELLGFGMWENMLDNNTLQVECARRENIAFGEGEECEVSEIHDHDLHIQTHTAFMLSKDFENMCRHNKNIKQKMIEHIRLHKQYKKLTQMTENTGE